MSDAADSRHRVVGIGSGKGRPCEALQERARREYRRRRTLGPSRPTRRIPDGRAGLSRAVSERIALVEQLHGSPCSGVIAVTGGGALLLADLLTVSGASATVLEASVPYSAAALENFIGATPERACSVETACDIAMAAWTRAIAFDGADPHHRFGLGCTASLATTTRKRGEHRAHIALQTLAETRVWSLTMTKGARDRLAEERLVADIALTALADTFGIDASLDLASARRRIDRRGSRSGAAAMGRGPARPRTRVPVAVPAKLPANQSARRSCCFPVRSIRCTTATSRWRDMRQEHLARRSRSKSAPTMSISRC